MPIVRLLEPLEHVFPPSLVHLESVLEELFQNLSFVFVAFDRIVSTEKHEIVTAQTRCQFELLFNFLLAFMA